MEVELETEPRIKQKRSEAHHTSGQSWRQGHFLLPYLRQFDEIWACFGTPSHCLHLICKIFDYRVAGTGS